MFLKQKQTLNFLSESLAFIITLPLEIDPEDNYFTLIPDRQHKIRINNLPADSFIELSTWDYMKKRIKLET